MKSSRNLDDLLPPVRARARAFLDACAAAGIDVLITSTLRDVEAQNALYAQGRTAPGKIVTNARGGDSWHNWGCAIDFVPMLNGKCQWSDLALFRRCGEIAEANGLEWAGRWTGPLREMAHCQFTGGLTLADFKAGKTLKEQ